jgi:hypothetical protein
MSFKTLLKLQFYHELIKNTKLGVTIKYLQKLQFCLFSIDCWYLQILKSVSIWVLKFNFICILLINTNHIFLYPKIMFK